MIPSIFKIIYMYLKTPFDDWIFSATSHEAVFVFTKYRFYYNSTPFLKLSRERTQRPMESTEVLKHNKQYLCIAFYFHSVAKT